MTEETGAQEPEKKSVDDLMKGFDKPDKRLDSVVDFVESFKQEREQDFINEGLSEAVNFLKEEVPASERLTKGFIHAYAEENPEVVEAFTNRKANPDGWKKVLKAAREEMKSEFSTDSKITDAVSAAKASASGQTTEEPEPRKVKPGELNSLNDYQFREYKRLLSSGIAEAEALKSVRS